MIQAGSIGAPYIPVLGLVGSDLLKRRDDMKILADPFNPEVKTVVAKAYRPDFAFLHAQKADRWGNVSCGWDNDDTLLAEASHHVIVTVEEVVDDPALHGAGHLGCANVHAPVHLHRVNRDDLGLLAVGQLDGERRLARSRGADDAKRYGQSQSAATGILVRCSAT